MNKQNQVKKVKGKEDKKQHTEKRMFSSKEEQIDYMYGEDPIMCQALKNCIEDE
jgi:hypothetical protein